MTTRLKAGCSAKKVGRDGRTRATTLRLSEDELTLSWTGRRFSLKSSDERNVQVANLVSVEATGLNPWNDNESPLSVTLVIDDSPRSLRECSAGSSGGLASPRAPEAHSLSQESPRASAAASSSTQRNNCVALTADGRGTLTLIFDGNSAEAVADFRIVVAALRSLVPARLSTRQSDEAERSRLLAMFPDVDPAVVISVLESCGEAEVARHWLFKIIGDESELPQDKVRRDVNGT